MDALTRSFGPHTSYLPPEEKEDFDINMKGQLEGIGAVLRKMMATLKSFELFQAVHPGDKVNLKRKISF